MTERDAILTGALLDDRDLITLADLCQGCRVESDTVFMLVKEGILDPVGESTEHWQFSVGSLSRVRTVIHLQRDLGINLPGAALALDLLDQIARLERQVN